MKNTIFRKKSLGRRSVVVALCIFLITTSMAVSMAAMIKTNSEPVSEITVSNEQVEKENVKEVELKELDEKTTSLSYSFEFAEPKLEETELLKNEFTKIKMPGCMVIGRGLGAPNIPVKFVKLLLPPGQKVAQIEVIGEPVEVDARAVDLKHKPVIPHQEPVPFGVAPSKELAIETGIYESSDFFPSETFKNQGVAYSRGYAILTVALNPVEYIPEEGRLFYYPKMKVDIKLQDNGKVNQFYRSNPDDEAWVKKLVDNPEMTNSYTVGSLGTTLYPGGLCDPIDDYDYVIITTTANGLDHWVTTPSIPYNWTSLMDKHEAEDGLSCTLVTVQEIDACQDYWNADPLFDDTQAHIREFCKDAYQDWGTDYIFIGADAEWIPARLMDYDYESNCDADIYWNHLDKTFNADHDSDWGEEGDAGFDLNAEMFIGRITCDTPQDVSNWMKKSFFYADSSFKDYLENAAFYGGSTGWNCGGDDFIDYSAIKGTDNWLGPIPGEHGPYPSWLGFNYGFETWNNHNFGSEYNLSVKWTAESSPNPGWQGGSESSAIAGLKNAINNNQVTLISGIAHANEGMSLDVYDSSWESDYHNTMPFFIHDYGCHCGDMDAADDGVLHSMLFHSDTELAFACVYHTGYGWGSFDDTNSSSALQQKLFWDYMFDTTNNSVSTMNWQMGKAMAYSKDVMAPTINWTYSGAPGSWRGTIESCLLFGDPAQRLKPPVQPEHNIGIQKLDVSSHEPADTDIWVNVTLYNNGKHNETNVEVRFLVDGMDENSTNISLFVKGNVMEVGWLYHTPSLGWETLCVNVTLVPGENITIDNVKCIDVIYGPDIAVSQIQAPSYIGQGYAEPVKGFIENLGPTDETITIQFYANDTLENSTSVYLTSGSNTWVTFMWDATTSGLGTYDVMIHAVPVPNEYYVINQNKSKEVIVFEPVGKVLLVDDDEGDNYEMWYENALLAINYVYDLYDRDTQPAPDPALMQGYTAVIWFTGDDSSSTLQSDDTASLSTYLDNGGKLFVSGQDLGYDINTDAFYANYLHANYQVDTAGWDIVGETGDVIGDGLSFGISSGDGANNQDWPDGISPLTPATSCFYYDGTSYKAGIKVTDGVYRIVYFGFGFEAINHMDARTTVMSRILSWLAAEHDIAVTNLNVLDYVPYNETTYVKATIINGGINDESNIVINFTVNGTVENTTIISSLNAGQFQQVSFAWNPEVGTYLVGIEAEPVPGENITSNNALYKTVHVVPAPDIWVDPTEFNFYLNEGVEHVDTLTIGNEPSAEGNLTFDITISGSGAGEWTEQWSHTYGGNGHSQFAQPVGDIDEDGKNETLVGGYASDTTIILSYNPGTGNYEQEYEWTEGSGTPSGACVVDLDDDGDLEFAVSWVYGSANGVYAYDWDGATLTELDYYSGTGFDFAFDVYACDYDEDNDTEVLIANDIRDGGSYHVTALGWSAGSFVFEAGWGSGVTTECPMIWSGDTDGDGHIEVIAPASDNTVYALNWNGVSWDSVVVASSLPSHPYAIVCGDINDDGKDEIGIGLEGTDAYVYGWCLGNYFQDWHINYPGEQDIIEAMYFGDADNDGDIELLIGTDDIHVIDFAAGYYYEESLITQTAGQLAGAIIADMDDDGLNEVKACDILTTPGNEWIIEWTPGWLSVNPTGGLVYVGGFMDLDVIVNTTGLSEGLYQSFIIVASNDLDEPLVYIPVNLTVVFEDDVGAVSVNYPVGVNPPAAYIVNASVRNFGTMNQTNVVVNCSIYEGTPEYFEDFETDDGGYTHGGPTDLWQWGTPTDPIGPDSAYSGIYCWGSILGGEYGNSANAMLDSIPFTLTSGVSAELSFWQWYDTELRYDGGNVKISTDGGSNWEILGSYLDPYNEDEAASGNAGIPGEPCFSGHDQGYWELVTFDLSAYAGEEITLRWHFGSDTSISYYPGWFIDDVRITYSESLGLDVGDLVYTAETTLDFIATQTTEYVEFTPPWSALPGFYAIKVKTMLPGDQDPGNDQAAQGVNIIGANDTGVFSINYPTGLLRPDDYTVNVTVRNYGSVAHNVPVKCLIYNETGVLVYSSDTTVFIPYLSNKDAEFSPPWHVTEEGEYRIYTTTLLPGDLQNNNNATEINVTVQYYTDAGTISVNYPGTVIPPGLYTVNATIENFGGQDKMIPVNCTIIEGSIEYVEDFESDDGGYIHSLGPGVGTEDDWEWGIPTSGPGSAHSGVNLWATILDGDYNNNGNGVLDSIEINLAGITSPELKFWHWMEGFGSGTEAWDSGNMKISTNGGSSWTLIVPEGGYPCVGASSNEGIPGEPCLHWDTNDNWEEVTCDLSAYQGETVIIRWHWGSSGTVVYTGWYVDDVTISSAVSSVGPGDPVYYSDETIYVPALSTAFVEFTPPWDAMPGIYAVKVTTMLPGDETPSNDQNSQPVTVIAGTDVGVVSINYPTGVQRPGDFTVNATIENAGSLNQTIPVNCSIYNETGVIVYSSDTTVFIPYLSNKDVEFSPPWHAIVPGEYLINVSTHLTGDEDPRNNANETQVFIQPYTDVGTVAINYPPTVTPPGDVTVNATVENFGDTEQLVPVNCSIYEGGVGGIILEEGFEGAFPPDDWSIIQYSGSGTWGQEAYATGDSHEPPDPTGSLYYAEADDNEHSSWDYDVGLFTLPLLLTGYDDVTLTLDRNFQDFAGSGYAEINTYSGGTDPANLEENLLFVTEDDPSGGVHTILPFNPSAYSDPSEVYIEFYYNDESYSGAWKFCIDNVNVSASMSTIDVGDIIYSSETTVTVPPLSTVFVEFSPSWQAMPGNYGIKVTTMLINDETPGNDQASQPVSVIAGRDAGAFSINYPTWSQLPDDYIVNATIENAGSLEQTIPVHCAIYNETDVLVYEDETSVFIPPITKKKVEFTNPWHAAIAGDYRINVTTMLTGDEDDRNNATEIIVTIESYADAGIISINYPSDETSGGSKTVNATIENCGNPEQAILVNCSIYSSIGLPYIEDFESNDGNYTSVGPTMLWEWGTPTDPDGPDSAYSGSYCWGTNIDGDYVDDANAKLDSILVTLPIGVPAELSFWHWYDTELRYDGGNVKISTDGGSNWDILGSYLDPYNEDEAASSNAGIPGEPCFSGHGQGYWELVTFDLSSYAGEEITLRWHFGSDGSVSNFPGWYIDDVVIDAIGSVSFDEDNLIYSCETTVNIPPLSSAYVEFNPPWNATPGVYAIQVKTMLPGDENPDNDLCVKSVIVTVICGDCNNDGIVDVGDVVYLINYLYKGGPEPTPMLCAGDANGDSVVDLGDVVYLVNYLFKNGSTPGGCC